MLKLLTQGKPQESFTVFPISKGGLLMASQPLTVDLPPNNTNLTTVLPPQHVSTLLGVEIVSLPKNYSTLKTYPKIAAVYNQGKCGSCWAVSTTSALNDMNIVMNNTPYLGLNPIPVVSCTYQNPKYSQSAATFSNGCKGGLPEDAVIFLEKVGTNQNKKLLIQWTKNIVSASNKISLYSKGCNTTGRLFKAQGNSGKSCVIHDNQNNIDHQGTIHNMKQKIKQRGAIVGKMRVYKDFQVYSTNGYSWNETNHIYINNPIKSPYKGLTSGGKNENFANEPSGGHAVEIMGWGVENIKLADYTGPCEYWHVKNSWGSAWGTNGYFKIAVYKGGPAANFKIKNCNQNIGLDIPFMLKGQLFGGAVTFLPESGGPGKGKPGSILGKSGKSGSPRGGPRGGKGGLSVGAWVGIAVGIVVVVSVLLYFLLRR